MYLAAFCGSRSWTDEGPIAAAFEQLPEDTHILVGEGDDGKIPEIVIRLAKERGFPYEVFTCDYESYGRSAHYIRDERILERRPHKVFVFRGDNERGPLKMARDARRRGISVEVTRALRGSHMPKRWGA